VYHLVSKTIYRRIGNENLRNRRRHSVEFIRTRLLLLDFVLANSSRDYLETEPEKLRFFCEELGIPRAVLPAKSYEGSPRTEPTLRYFVDKFPLFVERAESSPPTTTFSYVDPGQASLAGFANHLHAYLPLFRQLRDFSFLYIVNSPVHSVRVEQLFSSLVKAPLEADVSSEILRHFRLRNAWELKKYGSLSANDVEWLKEATHRIKRVIDKIALEKMAKTVASDGVLRGSLSQMNVIDLVQSLEMGRKSCALNLTNKDEKCEMYVSEGQVTHAVYGSLVGDPAVFKVLRWTEGNFQIDFEGKTSEQTTQLNTQGLLMEGLRLLDESAKRDGDEAEEEEDVLLDS